MPAFPIVQVWPSVCGPAAGPFAEAIPDKVWRGVRRVCRSSGGFSSWLPFNRERSFTWVTRRSISH